MVWILVLVSPNVGPIQSSWLHPLDVWDLNGSLSLAVGATLPFWSTFSRGFRLMCLWVPAENRDVKTDLTNDLVETRRIFPINPTNSRGCVWQRGRETTSSCDAERRGGILLLPLPPDKGSHVALRTVDGVPECVKSLNQLNHTHCRGVFFGWTPQNGCFLFRFLRKTEPTPQKTNSCLRNQSSMSASNFLDGAQVGFRD